MKIQNKTKIEKNKENKIYQVISAKYTAVTYNIVVCYVWLEMWINKLKIVHIFDWMGIFLIKTEWKMEFQWCPKLKKDNPNVISKHFAPSIDEKNDIA